MSYQVAKLIARIAENLPEMSQDIMQGWIENPKGLQKVLKDGLCPPEVPTEPPPLLTNVGTISVLSIAKFAADDEALKAANIGWPGPDFKRLFMGKIEENVPEAKLIVNRLERNSLDAPILAQLGNKAETMLAHMFCLLNKQAKGEDGFLLTNGFANVFYNRGTDGNLWAVSASWNSCNRCWSVEAYLVRNPSRWNAGNQIVSRDS